MVGRQLSRYRIVEEVGSGGMAVVYRGLDTSLDREVAVKVLHPHLAGKEDSRRRFSREARAVARLHHPHILEIYDFSGDEAAESFIVTEFIRGQTLRHFAEAHPVQPPEVAAMITHELADALEHAHAIGVIHRDLKPENVMIRDDGCLKVTDFGIARILDREDRMTQTGALVGSPAHMAPEIIEGDEAGPEADIFSLGTILYWLCTRKLPFLAANTTATLKRILDGQFEDPRVANPQVSDGLAEVITRCLARAPEARYPSAAGLRDALAAVLAEVGLARPADELAAFFADPGGAPAQLSRRIVTRLLEQGRACVEAGQAPTAMSKLGQVLALDPTCAEAHALLGSLRRRTRRRKRIVAGLITLLCLTSLGLASAGAYAAYTHWTVAPPIAGPVIAERPIAPPVIEKRIAPPVIDKPALRPVVRAAVPVHVNRTVAAASTAPGTVLIVPRPYADIFIDGRQVKTDALEYQASLPPGKHLIRLEHASCITATVTAEIPAGGKAPDVRIRLDPQPAHLRVENGQNAGVFIDGKLMGTSKMSLQNPFIVSMPRDDSGRAAYRATVHVTLTQTGFKDASLTRVLLAGQTATLTQELAPQ